ncbi:unnamed protein product [Schistosoma rodhaini]|uniref:Septate junction protein n=1 Tax=Schistosoma rodhaini TaxID=6188 RepID=A0AA85EUD3_9TREM|nr:unnamed protein product [Schistosoma rodhaini]
MLPDVENKRLFSCIVFFTAFGFCSNFISFVSPYWIQSVPEANSQFQRIGLWTVCFDGYMLPGLYDRAYFGCYYIYYVIYDRIRDWLNPIWLYAIQVTSSCGVLVQFLVMFIVLSQVAGAISKSDLKSLRFIASGHFFTSLTLAAALVAFAVARYDSRWMPYPELNTLSWSYAFGVLSFICTFIGFIISFITYIKLNDLMNQQNTNENLLNDEEKMGISSPPPPPPPPIPHTSILNEPNYYTEPRYMPDLSQSALSYIDSSNKNWHIKDSEITYNLNKQNNHFNNSTNSYLNT